MAGHEQFLDTFGRIAKAAVDHRILVVVLVLGAHAAGIERDPGLGGVKRGADIIDHPDRKRRADIEIGERHAIAAAGKSFFHHAAELGLVGIGCEMHRKPAIGDFGGHLDVERRGRAKHHGNVRVAVHDRLERLAKADRAGAGIGQLDFLAVMADGAFALPDLFHDGDIIAQAGVGLAPGLAIPALDDLRAGHANADDHAAAAGQSIDCLGAHGAVGRRAGGKLGDPGAKPDALGVRGDERQRRHRIRAVGFGRPDRVESVLFGKQDAFHRNVELCARVTNADAKLHHLLPG